VHAIPKELKKAILKKVAIIRATIVPLSEIC
jgi:hypothetical protein